MSENFPRRQRMPAGNSVIKKSVAFTADTWAQVDAACQRRGLTLSFMIRQLIVHYLPHFLASDGKGLGDSATMLDEETMTLVKQVATRMGMTPAGLLGRMLEEHLGEYVEEAEAKAQARQEIQKKLN